MATDLKQFVDSGFVLNLLVFNKLPICKVNPVTGIAATRKGYAKNWIRNRCIQPAFTILSSVYMYYYWCRVGKKCTEPVCTNLAWRYWSFLSRVHFYCIHIVLRRLYTGVCSGKTWMLWGRDRYDVAVSRVSLHQAST